MSSPTDRDARSGSAFAGLRIPRRSGTMDVDPRPIAAVVVGRRPRDRQVRNAAVVVDRRGKAPHVRPLAVLPAVGTPCLVVLLARLRNGLELPQLLAGHDIERARVADGIPFLRVLCRRGADDGDVLVDGRDTAGADSDGHRTVLAEAFRRLACLRVDRPETIAGQEENARRQLAVAGPVPETAR